MRGAHYQRSSAEPPKLIVSACLLGRKCAWDGKPRSNVDVQEMVSKLSILAVCPEVASGLPVPRMRHEIVGGDGRAVLAGKARVIDENGAERTELFVASARKLLSLAGRYGIKKAVLKSRSPSCGSCYIHSGSFNGNLIKGEGVTTSLLRANGITVLNESQIPGSSEI